MMKIHYGYWKKLRSQEWVVAVCDMKPSTRGNLVTPARVRAINCEECLRMMGPS